MILRPHSTSCLPRSHIVAASPAHNSVCWLAAAQQKRPTMAHVMGTTAIPRRRGPAMVPMRSALLRLIQALLACSWDWAPVTVSPWIFMGARARSAAAVGQRSLPEIPCLPSAWVFAECYTSGTRQTNSLPSAAKKTLEKIIALGKQLICGVPKVKHSAKRRKTLGKNKTLDK